MLLIISIPLVILLAFQGLILQAMNQSPDMCDQITLYAICYVPGAVFLGLNDLARRFFIQKGEYNAQKFIEITGAII